MTTKEKIIQAVEELPPNATIEDAMERLLFLAKVERGLKQADAGETIWHMEVKERMAEWPVHDHMASDYEPEAA